jgi:pimeloyl-ACP methyl ester carboxylesterase
MRGNRAVAFSRPLVAGSVVCVAFVASVMPAGSTSSTRTGNAGPPRPPGDMYQPPRPLPERAPGTLIWAEKVALPLQPPATVWRVLYHSRDLARRDIAVSGFAVIPAGATPSQRPVYAWAHGSAGQADRCAPSRTIPDNLPPYGGQLVANGVALVATDYQGLGPPGPATTYVGIAEGRAVLDGIRAAAQLPGISRLGPVVIAGHSQGGGAALWAAQIAGSYAPALDVRGVAALAPAAEFTTIVKALRKAPFSSYLGEALWAVDGLEAAYGRRVPVSRLLTPAARADLPRVANECANQTIAHWQGKSADALFARDPLSVPSFVKLLHEISPGALDPKVPILLAQGDKDEQIPAAVSARLLARYCRIGATVTRRIYRTNHEGVIDAASTDVLAWISDRLHGRPARSSC